MPGIETSLVITRTMNGKIHFLLDPRGLSRDRKDLQRLPRVSRPAPMNFVAVSLARIERLPRHRQSQVAGLAQFGTVMKHVADLLRRPQPCLEAWILQYLRPQTVIS